MDSTLSAAGVERQLSMLLGVHHVDVNYVAGIATVHYEESRINLEAIRQRVIDCGYHCRGELVPAHVCEPADHKSTGDAHAGHAGDVTPGGADGQGDAMNLGTKAPPKSVNTVQPGHGDHGSHGGSRDSSTDQKADMMHDMGHVPGMSMQDMARDMRDRFLVALVFAVPVFLYSPMGEMFGDFPTPLGLDRKLFLFIIATGAIAYPVWPFLVAAWRAARNKVANMATLIVLSVGTGYGCEGDGRFRPSTSESCLRNDAIRLVAVVSEASSSKGWTDHNCGALTLTVP